MKVLITGGAGYIGTGLTYLLDKNPKISELVIYDNLSRKNYNIFLGNLKLSTKIRFVKGDILDSRKLYRELENTQIVYHLAAKVSTPLADHNPHGFDQVNNWGTAGLTYLIGKSNVKKFIFTSSVSVYGASEKMLDIRTPLNPKTFYGISKMHAEEHIHTLQNPNLQTYILRLGNVYGYNKSMRFDSVINKFTFEANFLKRIKIFGNGNQLRSFIHINRLSRILYNAGFENIKQGTYNVLENTFSINQIVKALKTIYPDLETIYVNQNTKMRSLSVARDERLLQFLHKNEDVLILDLQKFKTDFSF